MAAAVYPFFFAPEAASAVAGYGHCYTTLAESAYGLIMISDSTPYHICQVAARLIGEHGFDAVDMAVIAREAGLPEAELYTLFGSRQDVILFLYQSINADWQLSVEQISGKKLADRFEQAMLAKISIVKPYNNLLAQITGLLLQPGKIGVRAPRTSHIRAVGLQTMSAVINGAADAGSLRRQVGGLPSLLYMLHWAILFVSIHTGNEEQTKTTVKLAAKMLRRAGNLSPMLRLFPFFNELGSWAGSLLQEAGAGRYSMDRELLKIIFNNRKTTEASPECYTSTCETYMSLHEAKIHHFTEQNRPLHFILPAFPAKSPNMNKVLGKMPDLGEEISLKALDDLGREIQSIYAPGAKITICSDGRIFSELVGVSDAEITSYVTGIKAMIARLGLRHVDIVNLEDLMPGNSFSELRDAVLTQYAEPLENLQERLKTSVDFKSLFNGIHRFISDDRRALNPQLSASKVKAESAVVALKVIQHSNAWTRFLAYVYPDAIRLSIHPYPAHSDKIGIRLTKAADNWLTPWHGVIVLQEDGYILMKKNEATALGARLVLQEGQPYYYTMIPE